MLFSSVYTGRREEASPKGLAYDIVTTLADPYKKQGYSLYMDNFYTSMHLLIDLRLNGFNACGTCRTNRKGFPKVKPKATLNILQIPQGLFSRPYILLE